MKDLLEHEIKLDLASGAHLTILYFSDRELRWIFAYDYVGEKKPGTTPDVVNQVRLTADYANGLLAPQIILSMHLVIPERRGKQFFAGMDISPGAKTYLEFSYERAQTGDAYRLVEICKGARERVRLDTIDPALMRPVQFPFPVPDRVPIEYGRVSLPFRTNSDDTAHFDLPVRTLR